MDGVKEIKKGIEYDCIPIIEYKKHMPKKKDPEIQCEGQIKFDL